jgi:hypothetical protein
VSGRVFGYTFGRVPTWLLDAAVSDRAIRLFALLTRYADRDGRGFPGRRALAERLRCSVDSLDRALRELVDAGAVRVEERWDVAGDGGRLTNDYYLLEHRDEDPGRTDAAPPGRTDAAPPGRTDAAPPAAPMRPLREREPEEREPGVNETPPSIPPPGRSGRFVLDVTTRHKRRDDLASGPHIQADAVGEVPTHAAALLPRLAGTRQAPPGRPVVSSRGRRRTTPAVNPVDARILASIRRSENVG